MKALFGTQVCRLVVRLRLPKLSSKLLTTKMCLNPKRIGIYFQHNSF